MQPRILIVYTGGTIGMTEDLSTGALVPFSFDHLMKNVPKIGRLGFNLDHVEMDPPIDSSNMNPACWARIASVIADRYEDFDGFVVLHGTDTMAYTASALSFMLPGLAKPVVLTGSQLPIGEIREDGTENLITALQIAAARTEAGAPMVQEVAIFADRAAIDEELSRLDSHIHQAYLLMDGEAECGSKLNFLVQEMNREVNTIGSKALDAEIARLVVEAKSEIEKLREQIQNVE